jgi:nicotinamidase-related amidase
MQHTIVGEPAFDPASTAVVVVDMINEFLEDGGLMVLAAGRALYDHVMASRERMHRLYAAIGEPAASRGPRPKIIDG